MTSGTSIVFNPKAVIDETFIRNSSSICKSIVGIDASQLYPFSMCEEMPTGLYTRWEFDTEMQRFKDRRNPTRNFNNMVKHVFLSRNKTRIKLVSFLFCLENRKKLIVLMLMVTAITVNVIIFLSRVKKNVVKIL